MGDTTFTEMGQALDAASQSRDTSNSVSSGNSTPSSAQGQGTGSEGSQSSVSNGGGGQPPKTETSPSAADDKQGNPTSTQKDTRTPDDKDAAERKQRNQYFAQRRIAEKSERKRRFEEQRERLQREHDNFANKDGQDYNEQMALVKQDQIRELEIQQVREAQEEWEREAYELFSPEDAKSFIEDTKRLGDWLNNREPELLSYLDRPYGKLMLKGWIDKIAKNGELADKWESLNPFEKYKIIDKYYSQLEKFGEDYAAGKVDISGNPVGTQAPAQQATQSQQPTQTQTPTPKVPNAPVPGSGRDTNTMPPSNNFALMLQDAMNKRRN